MKKLKQSQLAKEVGISKGYLIMILNGQRKASPKLVEKLQSIPGVHKVVKNHPWLVPSKQRAVGSNPSRDTAKCSYSSAITNQASYLNARVAIFWFQRHVICIPEAVGIKSLPDFPLVIKRRWLC